MTLRGDTSNLDPKAFRTGSEHAVGNALAHSVFKPVLTEESDRP